jgi:hypothetical protein
MENGTDSVSPQPTVLFRMAKYPELPSVHRVEPGADLGVLLVELLGGEPQEDKEIGPMGRAVGVIRIATRGDISVHVHTRADAEEQLHHLIDDLRQRLQLSQLLQGLFSGLANSECVCGQCDTDDVPDDYDGPIDLDAADDDPARWS